MGRPLLSSAYAHARPLLGATLVLCVAACMQTDRRGDAARRAGRRLATVEQQGTTEQPGMTKPAPEVIPVDARGRPILPLIYRDACEGENCVAQFDALACAPTALRAVANDSARVVTRVKAGDTLSVNGRDLHVTAFGMVMLKRDYTLDGGDDTDQRQMRRDTLHFARGDTIYLLRYFEPGWWRFWRKGKMSEGHQFWGRAPTDGSPIEAGEDSTNAVARSIPETEDWWYVQPRRGMPGWWHADADIALQSIHEMAREGESCMTILQESAADSIVHAASARDSTGR
jgi:hypothetical protein